MGARAMQSALILLIAAATSAVAAHAERSAAPSVDETSIRQGAEAWEAGDFARALGLWRPLAAAGDADAQYNLAQAYRLGRGMTADPAQARAWYLKAARQDHVEAQANYGLLLFQSGDRKGALPWLDKAAVRGDARAQYVVGTALFNGDVTAKNWVRAYAMMTRAAAAGLPQATASLAEMDRFVPMNQRQQGAALARDLERSAMLDTAGAAPAGALVRAATAGASPPAVAATVKVAATTAEPVRPARSATHATIAAPPRITTPVKGPRIAQKSTTSAAMAAAPPSARAPRPAPSAAGGWRVQVGAYSSSAAAAAAWDALTRRVPGLVLRPYPTPAGAMTRLQAGPLASRADAGRACARIAATGTPCFPVKAK